MSAMPADLPKMTDWCSDNIGKRYIVWDRVGNFYDRNPGKFRFRFKKDASFFALKWL